TPRTRDALRPPADPAFEVTPCAVLGETSGGRTCSLYDTRAKAFTAAPEALARRVYLYDRWLDLYTTVEGQYVERVLDVPMRPEDPEEVWADERHLLRWDDLGDSASYFEEMGISAAFRYAATGSAADLARLEQVMRSAVLDFEATGLDGYLARGRFSAVP